MKKSFLFCALGAAILSMQACYYDNEEELYPNDGITANQARWGAEVEPIVSASCAVAGCHVSGTGLPDLTSYSGVKGIVDNGKFANRVLNLQDMPPSAPLTASQRATLQLWIDEGALNN